MADIFISYSQADRQTAHELAGFLESCGYDVWWDYDLVGGIQFRAQIRQQLEKARAAIVIWTPRSVESEWVIDEAEDAKSVKKLLPVRTPDLDFKAIPLGFRQLQTDPVDKPDRILKALDELGVKPSNPPAQPGAAPVSIGGQAVDPDALAKAEQFANWEFIKDSQKPGDYRAFIGKFPESPLAELARTRLSDMARTAFRAIADVHDRTPGVGESALPVEVQRIQQYIADFPDDEHTGLARRRLYSLETRALDALDRNSEAALGDHLRLFPEGMTSAEVRSRLHELQQRREDDAAWNALNQQPTRAGIEDYLKRFPLGAQAENARKLLAPVVLAERRALKWAMIKEQGFSDQLKAFIAEFGDGPEIDEARIKLAARLKQKEEDAWAKVKDARHPAPLLQFVRDFPDGARKPDALNVLEALSRRNDDEAWAIVAAEPGNTDLVAGYLAALPAGAHRAKAMHALGLIPAIVSTNEPAGQADTAAASAAGPKAWPARPRWKKTIIAIFMLGTVVAAMLGLLSAENLSYYDFIRYREQLFVSSIAFGVFLLLSALGLGWRRVTDVTPEAAADQAKYLGLMLLPIAAVIAAGIATSNSPTYYFATMPAGTSIATALAILMLSAALFGSLGLRERWRAARTGLIVGGGIAAVLTVLGALSYDDRTLDDFYRSFHLHYLSTLAFGGAAVAIFALVPPLVRGMKRYRASRTNEGRTLVRP